MSDETFNHAHVPALLQQWRHWREQGNKILCLDIERALRKAGYDVRADWTGKKIESELPQKVVVAEPSPIVVPKVIRKPTRRAAD